MNNPLLDLSSPPRFDAITPDNVAPALRQLLEEGRGLISQLESADVPATWRHFVAPMIDMSEKLGRAWGIVSHLHGVMDTPPWRDAYNDMLPEVTRYYAELGQNLKLFDKYRALHQSPEFAQLNATRQRIINNEILDFHLSGAELPAEQKPRFQAIQEESAQLAAKFSENLLDATNAWTEHITDETLLAGLPDDVRMAAKEAAQATAQQTEKTGWVFSLHMPSYLPVMQYADNRELRARMYKAYATRASEFSAEQGHEEWNNTPLIDKILALRAEAAKMLGYKNYAEISLVTKMAESPAQVMTFLHDLAIKAKPFAQRDIQELREFAASQLDLQTLEPWDIAYASEKLRQARYAFSEHEVRQYFPEPIVLQGLFSVISSLYSVTLREDSAPVWHPDVRFFRIERDGKLVGQFYLDLYARDTKRGGAWMDEAIARRTTGTGIQTPIAYLVCNFPSPVSGRPATFTHDDVLTLFHECGHGLHHLLTRVDELWVSGIRGVEWDAVELPSQFMENFCWEWDVLQGMTAHIDSGEKLPRALFDKMLAAKNFQSGMQTVRQIEFSLFDMRLHNDFQPGGNRSVMQLIDEVRQEVAVLIPPAWHRFPQSFSHIFAGGYAAGYYSYKWAEVLSADAFSAFEDAGKSTGTVLDRHTGERFLQEVLSVGGSRPALESFKAFRGREPDIDALLRHSGMTI